MLLTIKKVFVTASAFLLAGALVLAQNPQTVRGTVNDPSGEPVIGASVMVKDTMNGAITDVGGAYVLPRVNPGSTLVFSCIGYTTQEITWTGGVLNVVLEEDSTLLDETVVVGYGAQKKMNLSGAVSSVKMEDVLGDRPQPNVAAALQGAIPGLYISSGSNTPGQTGKTIQIRGSASFSGSSSGVSSLGPLVLIDNVPGELDALNPDDIETVSVLKDASASAIYGARAAAGVILITTKRPKDAQKVSINYSGTVGLVNAISTPSQVETKTLLNMYQEAFGTNLYTAAQNAGIDGSVIIENIRRRNRPDYGYDALKGEYVDMFERGIIDPTKVTRSALQNASSVAAMVLTTESLVTDIPQPEPAAPAANPGMGGMY